MNVRANEVANSYLQLMLENPILAIRQLPKFIEQARDINEGGARGFVEAVAGGPNYDWTAPMLDIIGIVYPELDKESRKEGLLGCLGFLDRLNYFNSQNNVELINEPWLVADIIINRGLYWCGYAQYCDLLERCKKWPDFQKEIKSARSEFWLSLAVVQPECSSLEVRANYYKQFSGLIDRTQDAIAAMTFNHAQDANKRDGTSIEGYIEKSLSKYDVLLHEAIRRKMKEEKWIRLNN